MSSSIPNPSPPSQPAGPGGIWAPMAGKNCYLLTYGDDDLCVGKKPEALGLGAVCVVPQDTCAGYDNEKCCPGDCANESFHAACDPKTSQLFCVPGTGTMQSYPTKCTPNFPQCGATGGVCLPKGVASSNPNYRNVGAQDCAFANPADPSAPPIPGTCFTPYK